MKIVNEQGQEIKTLDLGRLEAGKSKDFTYYLVNDTSAKLIDIDVAVDSKEVEVIAKPDEIPSKEKSSIVLRWSPSPETRKGLKSTIKVNAVELYS